MADLQKAFNCIPRLVVFEVLAWLGVPLPTLLAWAGAVSNMGRRFHVRGCYSQPVFSSTGFAEGDALSCVSMIAVDLLFHAWHALLSAVLPAFVCGRLAAAELVCPRCSFWVVGLC